MDTDLRIPVTSEQEQLIREAASQEPEGMTAWARAILLQAAREQLAARHGAPSPPGRDASAEPPSEESFHALAEQWRRETGTFSSVTKKVQHPAYRKIIDMGEKALQWVLRELRDRPGLWFEALQAITRQTPVAAGERADPQRARDAWLNWGKERGLID
jgi:hypothetical protein